MREYYFLFALAFIWIIFAVIQDFRKREVANWLNFSLIAFALAYKAFYANYTNNYEFFLFGLLGFAVCFVLANAFYYGRVFAGGDAKLLMALGVIWPYGSYISVVILSLVFVILLLLLGAIYSLIYSIVLMIKNRKVFGKEFRSRFRWNYLTISTIIGIVLSFLTHDAITKLIVILFFLLLPILFFALKSLDKCMIKLIEAKNLSEGDWLYQKVKVGKKTIETSVHGLSWKDIELLRKYNKKVLIKEGIPFTPAFLLAFLFMVFFYLILRFDSMTGFLSLFFQF